MTTRPADPAIPGNERLFRRLRASHLDGDRLLEDAIDSEGTSCDRERYRPDWRSLVTEEHPRVGAIQVDNVPTGLEPPGQTSGAPIRWDFFVVDDPTPENSAHAEVRVRRAGRTSTENDDAIKKRPHTTRLWLKGALAARFVLMK